MSSVFVVPYRYECRTMPLARISHRRELWPVKELPGLGGISRAGFRVLLLRTPRRQWNFLPVGCYKRQPTMGVVNVPGWMFGTRSIEGLYFNICHATVRLHFALIQRDSPRPLFEADHGIAYHIRVFFAHPYTLSPQIEKEEARAWRRTGLVDRLKNSA
jgi:hypothetical protein